MWEDEGEKSAPGWSRTVRQCARVTATASGTHPCCGPARPAQPVWRSAVSSAISNTTFAFAGGSAVTASAPVVGTAAASSTDSGGQGACAGAAYGGEIAATGCSATGALTGVVAAHGCEGTSPDGIASTSLGLAGPAAPASFAAGSAVRLLSSVMSACQCASHRLAAATPGTSPPPDPTWPPQALAPAARPCRHAGSVAART